MQKTVKFKKIVERIIEIKALYQNSGAGGGGVSHTSDWWGPATLGLEKGPKNLSESLKISGYNSAS